MLLRHANASEYQTSDLEVREHDCVRRSLFLEMQSIEDLPCIRQRCAKCERWTCSLRARTTSCWAATCSLSRNPLYIHSSLFSRSTRKQDAGRRGIRHNDACQLRPLVEGPMLALNATFRGRRSTRIVPHGPTGYPPREGISTLAKPSYCVTLWPCIIRTSMRGLPKRRNIAIEGH